MARRNLLAQYCKILAEGPLRNDKSVVPPAEYKEAWRRLRQMTNTAERDALRAKLAKMWQEYKLNPYDQGALFTPAYRRRQRLETSSEFS
jgi:hypothetical protein